MRKITFFHKLSIGCLVYLTLILVYVTTNYWTLYRHPFVVYTSLEERIPFIPRFVYIYIFGFISLLAFPIIFIKLEKDFYLLTKGILWIIFTSGLIFCIYPTTTIRPELNVIDKTTYFLFLLYRIDPPNNCFPSLHVSLSAYIAIFLHRSGYWKNYSLVICFLVIVSTMLIKEHAVVDIIGGLFLVLLHFVSCKRYSFEYIS